MTATEVYWMSLVSAYNQALRHRVVHLAVQLRPRNQGRDGVDDHEAERFARARLDHEVEGFLAALRLRQDQLCQVHAEHLGVARVEGVLGVHERGPQAHGLGLRDGMEDQHEQSITKAIEGEPA